MSLIRFCPNTSFHLPFPFLPWGSFVPLSYSIDRLSQTIPLSQLSLTIVSCITENQAFFMSMCCAVFLFSLENQVHVLQLQNKALPLGPVLFWERELVIILPHEHSVSTAQL